MAVVASSALYGTGIYGGSVFGTRNVSFALTGVAGTGTIESVAVGGFEIDVSERLGSVSATGSIGTISPNIQEDISGVSATGAIGTLTLSNTHNVTSVALTGSINTLGVSNSFEIVGVSGTTAVESVSLDGFEIDITEKVTGVSATGAVTAVQPVFSFFQLLPSFGLTGSIGTISPNVKEELGANAVTSVSGTALVNTVKVNTKENLLSTSATGSIGFANSNVIAVQFNFEAIKEDYSRRRTVILPRVA